MMTPFIQALEQAGGSPGQVFRNARLDGEGKMPPLIPAQIWYDFIQGASDAIDDPHYGFGVGFKTPFPDLPNMNILKSGGASLGESISALVVDAKRLTNMAKYSLLIEADTATLTQHRQFVPTSRPGQPDGFFVGFILRLVRQSVGVYWQSEVFRARVSDPAAIPRDHLPRLSVQRGQGGVRFKFPSDWLSLGAGLDQARLSELGDPVETDFVNLVEDVVARNYFHANLKLEDVSSYLGVSNRKVQQALRDKGLSFRVILTRKRITVACRLLSETELPVADIGKLVGYSGPTSFARAFGQRVGVPPKKFRVSQARRN